jgi:hypoxanthine phosphoribosyltransferase
MAKVITIKDKQFKPFITQEQITEAVKSLAQSINSDLKGEFPLFLVVLNGSFMFAADLLKEVTVACEISFVKLSSYTGTTSNGLVNELLGLNEDIKGRTVVIIEDIVDSGLTLERLFGILKNKQARNIKVATTLFKPDCYKKDFKIDYVGFRIPNEFVIGYGLDYDGLGRNLKDIYILA